MDYRKGNQQYPVTALDARGQVIEISDMSIPWKTKKYISKDFKASKHIVIYPNNASRTFDSREKDTIRFTLQSSADTLFDLNDSWIEYKIELYTGATPPVKLIPSAVDAVSCLSNLDDTKLLSDKTNICKATSACKFVYMPNSCSPFSRITIKENNSNAIITETENPALICEGIAQGQHPSFFEPDSTLKYSDFAMHVNDFVPAWSLCRLIDGTATQRGLPTGGVAPRKDGTARGSGDQSIPRFELESNYDAHTQVTLTRKALAGDALAANQLSMEAEAKADTPCAKILIPAHTNTIKATAYFPQVRDQLRDIANGKYFKLFPAANDWMCNPKFSPFYDKILIELPINSYADAFHDVSATMADTGVWTPGTNFSYFKIVDVKMYVKKLYLTNEAAAEAAEIYNGAGYSYPFTEFVHQQATFHSVQNVITMNFSNRNYRSLEKVLILCRKTGNVGSDANKNKWRLTMGCLDDSNGDANHPYDGLSKVSFKYLGETLPDVPMTFNPITFSDATTSSVYDMAKVKFHAEKIFSSSNGSEPSLFPSNFGGIGTYGDYSNVGYENSDKRKYNPCLQNGFFLGYDFRLLANSELSGLDISKSELQIILERNQVLSGTEDLVLDVFFCCGCERSVSANGNLVKT